MMRRKGKPRVSIIWDYFTVLSRERVECSLCNYILSFKSYCTSNLNRHLRLKHPSVFKKGKSVNQQNNTQCSYNESINMKTDGALQERKVVFNSKISSVYRKSLDEQVLRMIVKEYHPFNIVESAEMKTLVQMLNPNYELPSKKALTSDVISEIYDKTSKHVRREVDCASYVCISLEKWASVENDLYMSLNIHFISNDFTLNSYLISVFYIPEQNTVEGIVHLLEKIIVEWNLENKIVACVAPNEESIISAVETCGWLYIPCFGQMLNLIVQDSIEQIKETHCKVKAMVEYFKRDDLGIQNLANVQEYMSHSNTALKDDVSGCWNSTYDMFQSILQTKEPLISTIALTNPALSPMTDEDWEIVKKSCDVLKYFKEVTNELSNESQVAISKVPLLIKALITRCESFREQTCSNENLNFMIVRLNEEIGNIFNAYEKLRVVWEATFLDPRFKKHGFPTLSTFEETKQNIIKEACTMLNENIVLLPVTVKTEKSDSIWQDFDCAVADLIQLPNPQASSIIIEIDRYLGQPLLQRNEDPLIWWKDNQSLYPRLFELVKKRLCLVATSMPCFRIFSKEGLLNNEKRSRLTSLKMPKIVFLNANM